MLDQRSTMIAAPAAGLAMGLALWVVIGQAGFSGDLGSHESRLKSLGLENRTVGPRGADVSDAVAKPLFALTAGPGAVAETVVRLDGVSVSGERAAALVSVNGQPAQWVEQGQVLNGVHVIEVAATSATFDTLTGLRSLKLGQTTAAREAHSDGPGADELQEIPPNFRSPPPPASAPVIGG